MAWLPPLDEDADPQLAAVFAEIAGSRGWVSNVMRALAHAPEGLRAITRACRTGSAKP